MVVRLRFWTEAGRLSRRFFVLLIAALLLPPAGAAEPAEPTYWQGELVAGNLTWQLALEIEPDGSAASLEVPSLWIGPTSAGGFVLEEGRLAFDLPWEMGRVEARRDGNRWLGEYLVGTEIPVGRHSGGA